MFYRFHLPLKKWFWTIYLVGMDKWGCSASFLERLLDVHYQIAWLMFQKILLFKSMEKQKMWHRKR